MEREWWSLLVFIRGRLDVRRLDGKDFVLGDFYSDFRNKQPFVHLEAYLGR